MDIPQMSIGLSQTSLMNNVNIALLSKSLDANKEMGDNMVKMMEQSVTPNLGQSIDISV
ncbi:MAG: YjfB family protein [Lachnospiraceae bacterium]|nr:YjfB family protein [Lachnospiraceae bacterium]